MYKDWVLSIQEIKDFEKNSLTPTSAKILPCGCGVKVDLKSIVYPTIELFDSDLNKYNGERVDAFFSSGRLLDIKRIRVPISADENQIANIIEEIYSFKPDAFLELITVDFNNIDSDSEKKIKFQRIYSLKCKLLDRLKSKYISNKFDYNVKFAKGHSIRAGGDFIVFDFVKLEQTSPVVYTAFNHDTIITADSVLTHTSMLTTFVSINNALNDLFSNGVYENIEIFPVYDGSPEEVSIIKSNLVKFVDFYKSRGVEIKLHDKGSLNTGLKMLGATVWGQTQKTKRSFSGMQKSDEVVLTKHLGDLSYLSFFRTQYFKSNKSVDEDPNRYVVLQQMSVSNYLLAKVINSYLPAINENFDSNRHISFSSDISGPGIDVLLEAAEISEVSVKLKEPIFLFPQSLYFFRNNHTSSTNGPLVIAGSKKVIAEIEIKMKALGFDRIWKVADVE